MADSQPVLIGERTSQELREAQVAIQTAQRMIAGIVIALREAKGLPDSWQATQMQDGKYYLVDSTRSEEPE